MKGQNLRQLYESDGPAIFHGKLVKLLESGEVKPEDFSLKELALGFCGRQWYDCLHPANLSRYVGVPVTEAGGGEGVDVSAFSNITGQILFQKILEGWKQAVSVAERLVETYKVTLDGQKYPWLGNIYDEGQTEIRPGVPYPETQFGERYIESPRGQKFGEIVSLTKEMVYFDLTGQALKIANSIGMRMGIGKAKRIYDVVFGFTNNYKLNGTSYNTYLTSGLWVNTQSATPLVDWTSINQAYILKANILDPDTNNPIQISLKHLWVPPNNVMTANRIVRASRVETVYPGYTSTSNPAAPGNVKMESGNPLPDPLEVLHDDIGYQRLLFNGVTSTNANNWWLVGDFPKAFAYDEHWPITNLTAPPQSTAEFERDVVIRVKGTERGVAWVQDPRFSFKFYVA